jgi:hypothetical protein
MTGQNERSRRLSRAEVAAVASVRARTAVDEIVAESAGRTITELRSEALAWPGTNTLQPEPVACLESARELERAAHGLIEYYIRLAREAGRSWYEIGEALDLHWAAVASKESIADEAYDYALRYQPGTGRRTFSWMCPACQQQVTDNGPWPDPPEREDGHAADCARRTAQLDPWRRRSSGRGDGSG